MDGWTIKASTAPFAISQRPCPLPMTAADPITLEALQFFTRPAGQELLARAADLAEDEWQAQKELRARFPAPLCRAALALVELRRAGGDKFAQAQVMFFDRAGLEMASREEVARHRARRLAGYSTVMDLCCGIGGDLLELARHSRVTAVDSDRRRLQMARLNCAALGRENVCFALADVRHLKPRAEVIFIDPSRREPEERRVRQSAAYSPPLSLVADLRRIVPAVAAKVSPAIADDELPPDCEVEFVSAAGQCREAVLYCGPLATAARRATLLPGGHTLESETGAAVPVAPPGAFVYDPDPAVVRAHLIEPLARRLGAWKLDAQIAYLSGAEHVATPFARAYRVLACQPFHLKRLRRLLQDQKMRAVEIKKRRFPMTPEQLRRELGSGPGKRTESAAQAVTLILTRLDDRPVCLICEKVAK